MRLLFGLLSVALSIVVFLACVPAATPAPAPGATTAPRAETKPPPGESKPAVQAPKPAAKTPTTTAPKPKLAVDTPFYQGKTITLLVESSAGGGTDTAARVSAPYLTKYIPGNPRIIIRNSPGAAGVNANNMFFETARPDGLHLMQNSQGALSMQLAQRDIIKYDLLKYRYIGNISRGETVLMVRKGLRDRLTDPRAKPLVVPTKDGNESWQFLTMMGKEFLGWNIRWLLGYAGTSEMELALRRGEVDMLATSTAATINRLVQEGHVEPVTQVGMIKDGKFIRRADFPDVPTFEETLGDRKPSGIPWQAYVVRVSAGLVDKFMVAPPGTPDNIMAILREAFEKMSKDPKFDQTVKKTISEVYVVGIGDQVLQMTKQVIEAPPEALGYSTQLQKKFDIIR